jgi:hypothetical protein
VDHGKLSADCLGTAGGGRARVIPHALPWFVFPTHRNDPQAGSFERLHEHTRLHAGMVADGDLLEFIDRLRFGPVGAGLGGHQTDRM